MQIPSLPLAGDIRLPQIGLGLGDMPVERTAAAVEAAVAAGYRLFDTAAVYGNEAALGQALSQVDIERRELFVSTKLAKADMGYQRALAAFDLSLQRLGLRYVDMYLIHWPVPSLGLFVETWRALIRLRAEGRIRSIGVSNFLPRHLERLIDETGVSPAVNQIEVHPAWQSRELRALHRKFGIVTGAASPLGFGASLASAAVIDIAARYGRSPAQIVLRWHAQNDIVALPRTVSPTRMAENIAIFDFELAPADMAAIDGLDDPEGRQLPDPATFGDPGNVLPPDRTGLKPS